MNVHNEIALYYKFENEIFYKQCFRSINRYHNVNMRDYD